MKRVLALVLVGGAAWLGIDVLGPRRVDIRSFDPDAVARLDTDMWRSYYDRKPVKLYLQLADLMRRQFHFPPGRSFLVGGYATRAALVFKGGHNRSEYNRALPDLERYFGAIHKVSETSFDADEVAKLELEWWIVHRQPHQDGDLESALALAAAALYRVPPGTLATYAHERTVAMNIRDRGARARRLGDQDWATIEQHLRVSWRALHQAVQPAS